MNVVSKVALIVLAAAVLVGHLSIFAVGEDEVAVKLRFGEIVATDFEFKRPVFDEIHKFDRITTLNEGPESLMTVDRKAISAEYFVQWRIEDVHDFYMHTSGSEHLAARRLNYVVSDTLRNEFASRTLEEVVSQQPSAWKDLIIEGTRRLADEYGISIADFGIKQIELPDGARVPVGD